MAAHSIAGNGPGTGCRLWHDCGDSVRITWRYLLSAAKHADARGPGCVWHPQGSIYTTSLDVPPQDFLIGFPGITRRFEWFAIDYSGKFWIETPGLYRFRLVSDDGAMLYIDGQLIADNDGVHSTTVRLGSIRLAGGTHTIRVPYFQGPATPLH